MQKLIVFVMSMLSLACEAQHVRYYLGFTLSKHHFADTIPLNYRNGRATLPVTINGRAYRFLLDTGAGQTTIYHDSQIEGTHPIGFTISHDAIMSKDTVRQVSLPPMTLGSLTFTGCHAIVQNRIVRGRDSVDGIIGFDLICKGLNAKIDVQNERLILSDIADFFGKEPCVSVPYRLDLHVPYVNINPFGDYQERVLFDTGSRQLYVMGKKSFDTAAKRVKEDVSSQIEGRCMGRYAIGHGGVEPRGEVVFLGLERLKLGSFAFHDVHTLTTQGNSHLGARLLEYGAVVFNPKRKRMCFQSYQGGQQIVVGNRQTEKAIVPDGGHAVIGLVWENSEFYKAGFREGDVIVRIDQQDINSFADYQRFRPIVDHVHTFVVRDTRGFTKEIKSVWK